jgi:hypothetical protein
MFSPGKFNSLTAILENLPPETPFFVPDDVLKLWFPPWIMAESPDPVCLAAAQRAGALLGCSFSYDARVQLWCFAKAANSNWDTTEF